VTDKVALLDRQQAFGFTQEDMKFLIAPMAAAGEEAIGLHGQRQSVGRLVEQETSRCTTTSSSCSRRSPTRRSTRFAKPMVMSLVSFIGPKPNLLDINQVNPPMRLEVSQPVLDFADMAKLREHRQRTPGQVPQLRRSTSPTRWPGAARVSRPSWRRSCAEAVDAMRSGNNILIISDRGISADAGGHSCVAGACLPFTSIWCKQGLRTTTGLVVETGTRPRSAPLCRAGRLWRRSRAPLPGHGNPGAACTRTCLAT